MDVEYYIEEGFGSLPWYVKYDSINDRMITVAQFDTKVHALLFLAQIQPENPDYVVKRSLLKKECRKL